MVFLAAEQPGIWATDGGWAPEVHAWHGKYHLFTTLHNEDRPLPVPAAGRWGTPFEAKELWGGAELSGGQWQRLVCGRALYRQTPLLILDEPTSQMDARGEHAIFLEIKRIAAERMTIVVTHQLENTRLADRILVMDKGRVIEQGRYKDLVNAGRLFAELVALAKDR
ncbi:hypothetical protein GCM10017771_70530 [Streptomyces capitiformicae]|uniref:ABC transporter domain-containing protein n=1 Tax=Streptomyces capitiformicae TaxID=2014920 RepID=A0A919DJW2_9ACTN|nr:hypothetical protein GCM10017771_70530 [Streptomyces capitiformicae]